jgi:hypothetical protein
MNLTCVIKADIFSHEVKLTVGSCGRIPVVSELSMEGRVRKGLHPIHMPWLRRKWGGWHSL